MGPENLGNGATVTQERYAGQLGYRGGRRDGGGADPVGDGELAARNGSVPMLDPSLATGRPSLTDLDALSEPVFPAGPWLDSPGLALADHPLLRGLLLELPPKGAAPPPGWLDRWFEAARSILELLYVQENIRR